MEKPVCSIIIRSYNEEKYIARLLDGVLSQSIREVEIILVDSGSTDATVGIAQRYPVKLVKIAPHEFSFGRALNLGVANANSDLLVFASAHVYPVYPDWLEKLLAPFTDPSIALTYGKQRGSSESKFSEQQVFAHWYPNTTQKYQDTQFCNNANAAVRRQLVVEHPYDETLPGLEDVAWAVWAMDQGHKIHYVPEAEIIHVHQETPKGVYNRYRREAMAFKSLFIHERFGFIDFVRISSRNIASDIGQAWRQRVLWKNLASICWFRVMQFWGTYQGYRHHGPLTWQLRKTFYYPHGLEEGTATLERTIEPINYPGSK